ncbi:hypothetical protein N0Y54_36655 [Nostoc punctiforme UO1]|uniref:hypothetical protein n=1 Tax=Nostoc punctiforme TaxID=272131 RepID=UPI0030B43ACF
MAKFLKQKTTPRSPIAAITPAECEQMQSLNDDEITTVGGKHQSSGWILDQVFYINLNLLPINLS